MKGTSAAVAFSMSAAPATSCAMSKPTTAIGQQAYGSEYGETSAHIVGDDKALVSFLVSRGTGGTFLGIGYGHDDFAGHVLAALVFALLLQQAESQSRFGGRAALGNIDDTEFLVG